MHSAVSDSYNILNNVKVPLINNIPNDQPLNQIWGWNMPSVTKSELITAIENTQLHLEQIPETANLVDLSAALTSTPARIQWFLQNVMVNLSGGNAIWVVLQLKEELSRIDQIAADFTPQLIPRFTDQDPRAQSRRPIDMMRQG